MPPEIKETPQAPAEAQKRLDKMGPMTSDEIAMLVTMLLAVTLWVSPGDIMGQGLRVEGANDGGNGVAQDGRCPDPRSLPSPRSLPTPGSSPFLQLIPPQVVGPSIGVSAVLAAMIGLCLLLCVGTLTWRDCLTYTPAWDTLTWFAVLIGMSSQVSAVQQQRGMPVYSLVRYTSGAQYNRSMGVAL
jgi:di/tricarboxylate transporter